jgi:hypothetical protein
VDGDPAEDAAQAADCEARFELAALSFLEG